MKNMFVNSKNRLGNSSPSEIALISLAVLCFTYALYIAIKYANQSPLDLYSFRQTQTGLTAFWFAKDGFRLAYETPVAGAPWSIPFEFPIYQYIVALLSKIPGISLDAAGRVVSFTFLALCIIPVRAITKSLKLSGPVFYIFVALLFSSPIYLYWGRTFMIETAALFFSVAAIKYFIDIVQVNNSFKHGFLFLLFITMGILQKATTGMSVLALLCLAYVFLHIKESKSVRSVFLSKKVIWASIYFGIPLVIGVLWTQYTDDVKSLNGLGTNLTSGALEAWNWGTLTQRLSSNLYSEVIWNRIFEQNISGILGAAILLTTLISSARNATKLIIVTSLLLGLAPIFLFTNLHIVHTYYQTANVIFLIYAAAVSLGDVLNGHIERTRMVLALVLIMVTSNYYWFSKVYLDVVKTEYSQDNSRDLSVSEILKAEIPERKFFVAFGNDWSSSFAYLAERKSFTVPKFYKKYEEISHNPENFFEEGHLGAVVVCPPIASPAISDLTRWASTNRNWKIGLVSGCLVAVPQTAPVSGAQNISKVMCQGSIDFVGEQQVGDQKVFAVSGWSILSGDNSALPEKIYVTLTKKNFEPIYLEALQIHPPNTQTSGGRPDNADSVFSRIIDPKLFAGKYDVGVAILNQGHLASCQFHKEVFIDGGRVNE